MKHVYYLVFVIAILAAVQSSFAAPIVYTAYLNGPGEFPPNASPGAGLAEVKYDPFSHMMNVEVTFSDLLGTTTVAHIHSATALSGTGTAGVATQVPTFVGFPLGVTSGFYNNTFDLTLASSWNPAFISMHSGTPAGAEAFFSTSLATGTAYFNIHTNAFAGGEIRGFMTSVPEPTTMLLLGLGLMGVAGIRKRMSL